MTRVTEKRRLLRIEALEQRALLSAIAICDPILYRPPVHVGGSGATPAATSPPSGAFSPSQILTAYGISSISVNGVAGTGSGQTIAIIDAYNDPDIISDAATFSTQFGLPQFNAGGPTFTVLSESGNAIANQTGSPSSPTNATAGSTGWGTEISLDVEWAHSVAPQANIILFEANSADLSDLLTTVQTAAVYTGVAAPSGVSVVSMSWGASEFSGETSYDADFATPSGHANITFLASTGDTSAPGEYPAYSPDVIAVGGTTLTLNTNNTWQSETAWGTGSSGAEGGGGGKSSYEAEPSYQDAVQTTGKRETPDVSFDANPSTGVPICDSYDFGASPWQQYGGTSLSCPCWAGLIAIADQFRASEDVGLLSSNNSNGSNYSAQTDLYGLYSLTTTPYSNGAFHDITSGSNGNAAGTGYDLVTGIGTPIANVLVPALVPSAVPDLTVGMTASPASVFHPGDTSDTYTITVTNSGTGATSGMVSLVDTLPAGLTATAFSGAGWTLNLSTLTATRSDPLAVGASYAALTLTVSVAAGASGSATNTATVSGGSEINTANDTTSDTVTIAPPADLTVSVTDSGNFKQGNAADTYTITVTNSGTGATSGTVSLIDTLPVGLTATAFSGTGWTVTLSTLTATRSDVLAAGASYTALTLTVGVAENAPTSVTNTVTVSGGGETDTANDTASDTSGIAVVIPDITGSTPALTGGTLTAGVTTLAISFSEAMTGAGAAANYELRGVGSDGLFNTSDDVIRPLSVSYSGATATLTFAALTESVYRLTVLDTITNTAGVALEGNGDGGSSGNWVTDFVVVPGNTLLGSAATVGSNMSAPFSVATGDFTGNGKLDLAVANSGNDTIQILLNNGNGTFTAGNSYATPTGYYGDAVPYTVITGDCNGDGKLDLAVACYSNVRNRGSGAVEVFLGNGDGTFSVGSQYQGSGHGTSFNPIGIAAADFNGDGKLDLAVANYSNSQVDIFTGNGDGTFSTTLATYGSGGTDPYGLVVGDFNGDGHPDIAVANYGSNNVGMLLNTGTGAFAAAVTYSSGGSEPRSLAVGDFNGDGKPDLVVGNYASGTIGILLNKGAGTFATAVTYSTGGTDVEGVAVADFNGDGRPDVVATNSGSNTIGVLLNNGNGTFAAATTFSTGSSSAPYGVAAGNFSGDGKADVVVTDSSSSTNAVAILPNLYGPSPLPLTTPNGFTFNVATGQFGPGEFVSGTGSGSFSGQNDAFTGDGRLYVDGSLFSPAAGTSAGPANGGQSLLLGSGTAAGLTVSREVTVPDTGSQDFARTVDTFTNSSGSSITTTVQIVANLGSSEATTVFATSAGGTTVAPGDQWIATDGSGTPAIVTYIHGPLSLQPTSESINGSDLQWTYSITVAAGSSVSLAYFTIVATTPAAAVAAANALVGSSGFGGQAAAYLSAAQLQSLANFANTSPVLTPPSPPVAGTLLSDVTLFHFSDSSAGANVNNYTAVITWGDGATSTVTSTPGSGGQIVVDANGGYDVLGSHVYTQATLSPMTLGVQVTNGAGTIGASDPNFTVLDAPLSAASLTPPLATAEVAFSDALVFHFSDANAYATASDFSAVITWGDGGTSTVTATAGAGGQIVADAGGFDVLGSYTYAQPLSGATFSVQVSDDDGASTGASQSGFSVADQPLLASGGINLSFAQGQAIAAETVLTTFTDPGGAQPLSNYSATIDWGDGTAASPGVLSLANGIFTVEAGHSYATMASPYTVLVSIVHNAMPAVTVTDTASISGPHTMAWVAAGNGNWIDDDWENQPPSYPDDTIDAQVNAAVVVTVTSSQAVNSLTLSDGATLVIAAGATLTVTDGVTLSSGASVEVESGATLVLAGLVQGSGTAGVTLDGGTLEASGAFTSTVPITIGAGSATVNTNGFSVTLAGNVISTGGGLTTFGAGALILSGANNDGGTTVSNGTLVLTSAAALSSMGSLVVSDGNLAVLDSSGAGDAAAAADTATLSAAAPQVETPAAAASPANAVVAAPAAPATVPATAAASTVGMIVTVSTSTGATGSASVALLYSTTPASVNPPKALAEPVAPVAGIVSGTLRVPLIRTRSVRSTLPVQSTVTATAPKVVAVGAAAVVTALPASARAVADAGLLAWVADAPAQLAPAATGRLSPSLVLLRKFGSRKWGLAPSSQTGWPRGTASLATVPVPFSDGASG
jgi:uncharacterized repeat protein (TIGR01451 family)